MSASQCVVDLEGSAVVTDGVIRPVSLCERDRHILQDAKVVGVVAEGQPIRGKRSIEIALALQRECLVEIVKALRLDSRATASSEEFPESHGQAQDKGRGGGRQRGTRCGLRQLAVDVAIGASRCDRSNASDALIN